MVTGPDSRLKLDFQLQDGKPLGARATNAIQMVGVAIILSITVLAVFNDISR